ncbi:MAG: c-type cytochrome [Acidobacteria bacterium]|nr:c-type cytochrome [Acidobacteriota bacterium]
MMRRIKIITLALFAALSLLPTAYWSRVIGQQPQVTEAPTGFDNKTNGMSDQATFDHDREVFEERETAEEGLGPVYNAQGCIECHQNPVTGAASQIAVMRAGHRDAQGNFVAAPGGSLIHDRAIDPSVQEYVPNGENIRTLRMSLSTLGDGYVEAIADETLIEIARRQARETRGEIAGQVIQVPLLEAPGQTRVGRFGWKNQHASLLSFSVDAYLNEMGITSFLAPTENTSLGRSVAAFDQVADPEDAEGEVNLFAQFMRATKAPARDVALANTAEARAGAQVFNVIGCAICHTPTIQTAPPGTSFNGGNFVVPPALGNRVIHPYGDYLLHDVGTGDGIVQNGDRTTANKLRTPPLWGLRTRYRLLHDGSALTYEEAITRHRGEAGSVINRYRLLNEQQRAQLMRFLRSL